MTTPGLRVDLVNMVREPVARVVSNFYFVRNPSRSGTTALEKNILNLKKKYFTFCEKYLIFGKIYIFKSRWRTREVAPKQSWFLKSLSDCVQNNDTECLVGILCNAIHTSYVLFY